MRKIGRLFARFHGQTTPRGRGAVVLLAVILLVGAATGEGVVYRVAYLVAFCLVGSYVWVWFSLRRLDMWVEGQSSVAEVGESLEGFLYVYNDSRFPTGWVEVGQMTDMEGPGCGGATRLPAQSYEVWKIERFCYTRGVYTVGPLVACSSDLLGLFRLQITRGDRVTVVVYPPAVPLPCFSLPPSDLSSDGLTWRRMQIRSSHVDSVREYAPGDSLNRIHWPSTAKCARLMSKEFDSGRSSDVWIVVDLERETHRTAGTERTDEYAVAAAASLARLALAEGRSVGLVAHGDREFHLPLGGGARQMSRVIETLAWSKTEGDTPLADVLFQNSGDFGAFASVLVVTSSPAGEWVSVLEGLGDRALRTVVVLIDATSFGDAGSSYEALTRLVNSGVPIYVVRKGVPLSVALSEPMTQRDLPVLEDTEAEMTPVY